MLLGYTVRARVCKQAMHCDTNCYVAKALITSEVLDHSTQPMHDINLKQGCLIITIRKIAVRLTSVG